jgi:hypothetical protein
MARFTEKLGTGFLVILVVIVVAALCGWFWILASTEPLHNPLARFFPWPIACSSRGCVTTTSWLRLHAAHTAFAQATQQQVPTFRDSLGTLIRQHLIRHSWLRPPVSDADAQRYRFEILNLHDDATLRASTGFSGAEYDRHVIIPFLEQEALREARQVESLEQLYALLGQERTVIVFPFYLKWDREKGIVVPRD